MVWRNKLVVVFVAVIAVCIGGLLVMRAVLEKKKAPALERLLSSEDSKGIKEAQDELIAAGGGRNVVAGLIAIIDEKENRVRKPASVYAAMTVLGEMRAIEAVDVLVEHIGFPRVYEGEPMPFFGGMGRTYPAVRPLIQIGEPCIGEVLRKLSRSDHRGERMACLGVLLGLRDQPLVVEMLKEAIENESDSIKRDRLQRGLNRLVRINE